MGCNVVPLNKKPVDAYLYIGVGKFHPLYAARKTKKPTYILNPDTQEFSKIKEETEKLKRLKEREFSRHESRCEKCGKTSALQKFNGMLLCETCINVL